MPVQRVGTGKTSGAAAVAAVGGGTASLNPADFAQGGILDDVDVIIVSASVTSEPPDGYTSDKPMCFLKLELKEEGAEKPTDQHFSAGDLKRIMPSEDGVHFDLAPGVAGLNQGTNAAMLLRSLLEHGFPADKLAAGDVSVLVGTRCHVNRIPQPKRSGLALKEGERERTVLVVTSISKLPWDKAGKTAVKTAAAPGKAAMSPKAAPGKAAPAAIPESEVDVDELAVTTLVAILEANGGKVKKSMIAMKSLKVMEKTDPNRAAVMEKLADEEFLASEGLGWEFDGETVTAT